MVLVMSCPSQRDGDLARPRDEMSFKRKINLGQVASIGASKTNRSETWQRSRFKQRDNLLLLVLSISFNLLLLISAIQKAANCLGISSIEIPPAIWNGSQVTFACNYELAPDDQLYSVKWYKDYVEFYRFQPKGAQDQTTPTPMPIQAPASPSDTFTAQVAGDPQQQQQQQQASNLNLNYQFQLAQPSPNSKHEFELEGINLDLSRSNATHVHLRQVTLATEATYKCEVSADSPTFATVSAERQTKVYVLPKQKLTLLDNSAGQQSDQAQPLPTTTTTTTTTTAPTDHHKQQQQTLAAAATEQAQARPANPNVYQLNDLINFTCVSAPSRPGARLVWLLNDEPLSTLPAERASAGHYYQHNQTATVSRPPEQLIETRSNLALRLQASQLRALRLRRPTQLAASSSSSSSLSSYFPLKLSCLSQLSVEFTSESSVLVSGGSGGSRVTTIRRSRNHLQHQQDPVASSWRQQLQLADGTMPTEEDDHQQKQQQQQQEHEQTLSMYRWPQQSRQQQQQHQQQQQSAQRVKSTPMTADFDSAWISSSSVAPSGGVDTNYSPNENYHRRATTTRHLLVWTNRQLRSQSEHIDQLLRKSGANQLEPPHIEARAVKAAPAVAAAVTTAVASDQDATEEPEGVAQSHDFAGAEGDSRQQQPDSNNNNNKDYELNELVNFTCHQTEPTNEPAAEGSAVQRLHSIRLKWFLNDKELTRDFINAWDGTRFYLDEQLSSAANQQRLRSDGSNNTRPGARSLLIEFTSSLLQLKELDLKCRIIVGQPLIEFEAAQMLYLATSPFIQVQQQQQLQQQDQFRPSFYNTNAKHRQQQQQAGAGASTSRYRPSSGVANNQDYRGGQQQQPRYRANVIRMRQSSRSSASSSRVEGDYSATFVAALNLVCCCLVLLFTHRH